MDWLLSHANYFLLLVIAAAVKDEIEKKFVGRTALVVNTAIIFVVASSVWSTLHLALRIWVLAGLPVALVSFFTYMFNRSLPTIFYRATFLIYNSVFAAAFVIFFGW